jgi:hypothetical protein
MRLAFLIFFLMFKGEQHVVHPSIFFLCLRANNTLFILLFFKDKKDDSLFVGLVCGQQRGEWKVMSRFLNLKNHFPTNFHLRTS